MIAKIFRYAVGRMKHFHYIMRLLRKNTHVHPSCDVDNGEYISIGRDVNIGRDSWIHCPAEFMEGKQRSPVIVIDDGVDMGRRAVISGVKSVHIGKNVLFAPNVYISDHSHKFEDVERPINDQGITEAEDVDIGENSWIGINACILPGCKIGRNCVVGANSVVTKSFPDYCVIAGAPARIIKKYDQKKKIWERVNQS
jgi:acetyltransferase-like isoleucine patch superfamily enzyme